MKTPKLKIPLAMLLSTMSFFAIAEDELSATEVSQLFSGNTVEAFSELKQAPVSLYYDSNGDVRGVFASGNKGATKWWVEDNGQICLKGKDGDLCFVVVEEGGEYQKYLVKEGDERVLAFSMETFSTGNTNNY